MEPTRRGMSGLILVPSTDYTALIKEFLDRHGIKCIIAFSGGADDRLEGVSSEELQRDYKRIVQERQDHIIGQAIRMFQGHRIAILTGGTKWGVPATATKKAKEFGLKTIGVYPLAGRKHALGEDLLDLQICVEPYYSESRWGDESGVFAKLLNGVIVYGGGSGTLVEVSHILKMNEAILKDGGIPKFIVPITGTGTVADGLPFIWTKTDVRRACTPPSTVISGEKAAEFLFEKLSLEDLYDI